MKYISSKQILDLWQRVIFSLIHQVLLGLQGEETFRVCRARLWRQEAVGLERRTYGMQRHGHLMIMKREIKIYCLKERSGIKLSFFSPGEVALEEVVAQVLGFATPESTLLAIFGGEQ
jgi:hypothetical protein